MNGSAWAGNGVAVDGPGQAAEMVGADSGVIISTYFDLPRNFPKLFLHPVIKYWYKSKLQRQILNLH